MKKLQWYKDATTQKFLPHNFAPQVELLTGEVPEILISRVAYDKMWLYTDIATKEVGWLGIVDEISDHVYLIEDVFLVKQEVSQAATVLTEGGLVELYEELLAQPHGEMLVSRIRFWGHSHVKMGTGPSFQDEKQMEFFERAGHDFFLRGIVNKRGQMAFTVYRYDRGLKFLDVPWDLHEQTDAQLRAQVKQEFEEKVKEALPVFAAIPSLPPVKPREEETDGVLEAARHF